MNAIRGDTSSTVWCMGETTPAPRAYILGAELQAARKRAGLVLRQLATQLGWSHSVLVRWEKGTRVPSTENVAALLGALGVTSAERDRLIALAREAAEEPVNTVSVGAGGMAGQLTALIEFEHRAVAITDVSPLLAPGLLQSDEYVRAIMGSGLPPDETAARATLRLGRREVITRDRAPAKYTALIGEAVLHQPVGSRAILADQLRLILKLGDLDNVDVRIIPVSAGWTPAHAGPFVLLEFATADPVILLEHHRSSAFLRDEGDVQAYVSAVEDVGRVAMSPADTSGLIADVINRMETTE